MPRVLALLLCLAAPLLAPTSASQAKTSIVQNEAKPCTDGQCHEHINLEDIKALLDQHRNILSEDVINTVNAVVNCANKSETEHKNILTIIDYSLPSIKKRLWVFDIKAKKLLYNTYVSHGIKSGINETTYFSNTNNSKATSLGVFNTQVSYNGRYGPAVRLKGLEKNFNHNAYRRALVIHPAWYVNEDFIKKYGRIGRSWGCPAVPYSMINPIVNTIKDQTLLVVYYPSHKWLLNSDFLTCENISLAKDIENVELVPESAGFELRSPILFSDSNNNNKRDSNEPIVVMSADNYLKTYKIKPPNKL